MPDIWMDVDTAVTVPCNIMPLIDPTDFKTVEVAIAYNEAGMNIAWNFVTTAGVMTTTAFTPTTAGVHDWAEEGTDEGMYSVEIPAAAGTVNNDTEGFGWISGMTTNCLPFRGPTIGFRAAALNNALIDGGDNLDVNTVQWLGTACATPAVAGVPEVDVTFVSGTAQTANDNGADINTLITQIGTAGAGLTDLGGMSTTMKAQVNTEADTALTDIGLDHLLAASVTGTDVTDDSVIAQLVSKSATADWDSFVNTADSLEALRDRGDAAWTTGSGTGLTALASGTAQGGTASTIQLASGETFADDELNGTTVNIHTGTGAGQSRPIYDYTGATDTALVSPNWITNPDATSQYEIVAGSVNLVTVQNDAQSTTDLKDFADNGYDPGTNKVQGVVLVDTLTTYTGNTVQTGDNYARLGAPAGASVSADIAAVKVETNSLDGTKIPDTISLANINAEVDTALSDINLDHIAGTATGIPALPAGTWWETLVGADNKVLISTDAQDLSATLDVNTKTITASAITAASIDTDAITADEVSAAGANKIADHVLRRTVASALASSDGDAKSFRSLLGATCKLVNRIAVAGATLTVYETDDSTSLGTQTVTTNAAADPITELNTT